MKRTLLAACAVAAFAFGAFAPVAAAQDAGEEIIVVAQRRAENLQDVPLAVSALSADRIEDVLAGGGDVLALAGRAPGLNIESSNGRVAPRFYIRGLGNTDFDLAASQPVSVIVDDVVQENVALKSFPLFDVQQIEVLRGPQGTLYGRNTPAGIVHIRTVRPSQDFDASVSASYGTYGTSDLQAALGGAIAPTLSGRIAVLAAHRDDWVSNGFTNQSDVMGGFDEYAARASLLWEPTSNLSILGSVHARSLEGTSTLFRANVFTAGSNDLNGNFDRDRVFYNQGGNNVQEYDNAGGALTVNWDLGDVALTAVTGYETAEGFSRGDIDGGVAGVGPGFIPFDSDTKDSLDDLEQWTQEIRLASDTPGPFQWQVGAFYFDSDLQVSTAFGAGPAASTLNHTNESWAVFGQGSYDVSDTVRISAGVRYTEDEKDLVVLLGGFPPVTVSDEQVSWDLTAQYQPNDDLNLYARVASGFRAPSIQGRDVTFGGAPSVGESETILSWEAGVKADVLDGTGRINAAVYYYTIEDMQLSAIGGGGNFNQLLNAEEGEGYGFEIESQFQVTERLSVRAAFTYSHTEIQDPTLTVAGCAQCTVRDPAVAPGVFRVDGNPFPHAPEVMIDVGARYARPMGDGGEFFAETDWTVRGPFNIFLYDAIEYETAGQVEGGLRIGYGRQDGSWEASVFARNITDEENVIGGIDFNNNTGFVNEPRVVGVALRARWN